ncbi:MAG TPA: DUF4340 domain-containing protein [Bacteroidetes bacterium]|nr:DUF4340 domain-containing protein [Bacteroidota bacterium]
MKKNYLLIFVFLVLAAGTGWYLYSDNDKGGEHALGWDRKFAVENPEEIYTVFIGKRSGETTILKREGDHWTVNGEAKASPNAVENVLEAITDVTLKFVPPRAATDHIVKELAARGIKVEVYNKAGKLLKAYYVGGVSSDARATFFIMEGAEQPMAVEIPQMEGQIRTRYDMTGDSWKDRTVFGYEPEDIQAVSIEYPKQRNKSFKLRRKDKGFEVLPFYDNVPPIRRPLLNGNVEGFLVGFKSLMAESFENGYAKKDSVRQTIPFAIISVTDRKGNVKTAAFYQTYRINAYTGQRKTDFVERYLADISTGDWMLTQHRVFQKVFWAYEGFFEPEGERIKD